MEIFERPDDAGTVPAKHDHHGDEENGGDDIGATRDVAFVARFLTPPGRWSFCSVALSVVVGHWLGGS
jgi:hypothetical protein